MASCTTPGMEHEKLARRWRQKVLLELPFLVAAEQLEKRAYPTMLLLCALSLLSIITQDTLSALQFDRQNPSEAIILCRNAGYGDSYAS
ncbi:hypothetical protein JG687_00017069 [Phytophthora cactorum]|uniref:Uncharacterized protein n=1 Tax=Phytophthora cactorum TaxID=29920 RepID=A0A8T1TP73_9STRA|nr:hypothetical protein PC128_g17264 [Phytophthora cactorum]KAG4058024.1 hypothetical protein PC123_g7008 [Phytophthora cactorum]KAG6945806.1 hypothetical protein JG687_00017069 [Phytophthora cactorum]